MTDSIIVNPEGLQTERGRLLSSGGGLVVARNVLMRRPGVVEPRGGLWLYGDSSVSGDCIHARKWRGDIYAITTHATGAALLVNGTDAGMPAISGVNGEARSADFGDRIALALEEGVAVIESNAPTVWRRPGVPRAYGFLTELVTATNPSVPAGTTPWLATNYATAYRIVFVRYVNGIPQFGAPSARRIQRNNRGAGRHVELTICTVGLVAGDEVHIYRTPLMVTPYTDDPGDEMRLRYVHTMTGASDSFQYVDCLPDDDWNGPNLYTNELQEGIGQANGRPGIAADVALYNGMAFYAQHTSPHRLTLTLRATGTTDDLAQTLQSVSSTGTTTTGNATITGVPAAVFPYLAVGQVVSLSSTAVPGTADATFLALTKVQSFNAGANTITLDKQAQTTGAVTFIAWDWIAVTAQASLVTRYLFASWADPATVHAFNGSLVLPDLVTPANGATGIFITTTDASTSGGYTGGAADMERAWSFMWPSPFDAGTPYDPEIRLYAEAGPLAENRDITLTFEVDMDAFTADATLTGGEFAVTSSKPGCYSITLSTTTAVLSEQDGGANVLAVSKPGIVEAVPTPNFFTIGAKDSPIVRIVSTSDSLWVWKTDGLWRLSGLSPEGLSIQLADPTCRALDMDGAHRWIVRFGDEVYAWTQTGIVKVNSSGVQRIDGPIASLVRQYTPVRDVSVTFPSSLVSFVDGIVCMGFASWTDASGATDIDSTAVTWLCYSPQTGYWSTWDFFDPGLNGLGDGETDDGTGVTGSGSPAHAIYRESIALNTVASATNYPITLGDTIDPANGFTTGTITSVAGSVATTSGLPGSEGVGWALLDSAGVLLYVTARDGNDITTTPAPTNTGAIQRWFAPIEREIVYACHGEGLPMRDKLYRQAYVYHQMLRGGYEYDVSFRSYNSQTTDTITQSYSLSGYLAAPREYMVRHDVPFEQSRTTGIEVGIVWPNPLTYFELGALVVLLEVTGERTGVPRG